MHLTNAVIADHMRASSLPVDESSCRLCSRSFRYLSRLEGTEYNCLVEYCASQSVQRGRPRCQRGLETPVTRPFLHHDWLALAGPDQHQTLLTRRQCGLENPYSPTSCTWVDCTKLLPHPNDTAILLGLPPRLFAHRERERPSLLRP